MLNFPVTCKNVCRTSYSILYDNVAHKDKGKKNFGHYVGISIGVTKSVKMSENILGFPELLTRLVTNIYNFNKL